MRLDERWLWLGDTLSARDAGIAVFQAHPGSWWIVTGNEMIGPLDDHSILRAVRVACTPTIDGCERGPTKLGITELSPRRPLRRGPRWREVSEAELPPSITVYDRRGLEPVSGCCTTSDSMPKVTWGSDEGWEAYLEERPARAGLLATTWNAHPRGSLVFSPGSALEVGFTVVDVSAVRGAPGLDSPRRTPPSSRR
jgi:hypothetical protein